ncbi:MAG: hypothetical protein A3F72_01750 [Bacteroidetes bacterium RIFCSPLOWO2_12_FULL_35_15]|nr:MAG: hypothetical protein A3F72_01750 [Bacteroidetes bacterium RIFCSPLOWO2_12_FULL_35_15]
MKKEGVALEENTIKRRTYDTRIKYLAKKGLLPESYKKIIHRSLLCKWKQEPMEKYTGFELNENIDQLYDVMKLVSEHENLQKALRGLLRIQKTLKDVIGTGKKYVSKLKKHKTQVVKTIERVAEVFTIEKACKMMRISDSTFRTWAMETYFKCGNSVLKLCSNAYPNQLTHQEIHKMHKLLTDTRYMMWPVRSLAYFAKNKGLVIAHVNTWYKYTKLFDLERIVLRKIYKQYEEGIRATKPDEIWHADVTELKMEDGKTAHIYLVIDNFSRFILSWRISMSLCWQTRLETFKEAVYRSNQKGEKRIKTRLIVDGGSENNNQYVEDYLEYCERNIDKMVAYKDILKSNSMVEYTNRTLKYEYLFVRRINNLRHLGQIMFHAVHDYTCVRPHGAIGGLTPAQAYLGKTVDIFKEKLLMKEAALSRVDWNQTHNCKGCPFGCN